MTWLRAAAIAALSIWGMSDALWAQDVTLTSRDGKVEITGDLLGFDGEFYRVETQFGELTVDSTGVTCDGPACPSLTDFVAEVTFSGAPTMAEILLPALIEGFARRNALSTRRIAQEGANFTYELGRPARGVVARFRFDLKPTDQGFADLLENRADVVMALREIRPAERIEARKAGLGDMTGANRSRVLALDALVPIVAPRNPVQTITLPGLASVLAGTITNWSELGGPDAPISVHLPALGSGQAQALEDQVLNPASLTAQQTIQRHDRGSVLTRTVAADPFALGIASFAETGTARALRLSGPCGFTLSATRRSIKTEDYPLTSPMFLYLPARRLPKLAREFLGYTRSPAAQAVIRRAGFVDQMPERIPLRVQGDRLANAVSAAGAEVELDELQRLVELLRPMERLTTSFRFETGSSRPDAQSRSNIVQLAQALEIGTYDARKLVFVGFSDGEGAAGGNKAIAMRRAKAVRDAVIKAAETANLERVDISLAAFGEALPMACDDSEWGRQVNRRVEAWVR